MKKWLVVLITVFGLSSLAHAQTFSIGGGLNVYTFALPGAHVFLNLSDLMRADMIGVDARFLVNIDLYGTFSFPGFQLQLTAISSLELAAFLTYHQDQTKGYLGLAINYGYLGSNYRVLLFPSVIAGIQFGLEDGAYWYLEGDLLVILTPVVQAGPRFRAGFAFRL
jgi:hypothetical protein